MYKIDMKPQKNYVNFIKTLAGTIPSPIWALKGENPLSYLLITFCGSNIITDM